MRRKFFLRPFLTVVLVFLFFPTSESHLLFSARVGEDVVVPDKNNWSFENEGYLVKCFGRASVKENRQCAAVAFLKEANMAVCAYAGDNTFHYWDLDKRQKIQTVPGPTTDMTSVVFSANGKVGLTLNQNGSVSSWNLKNGKEIQTTQFPDGGPKYIAISPDGQMGALVFEDGSPALMDSESGKILHVFYELQDKMTTLDFSAKGSFLAGGAKTGKVKVWDLEKRKEILSFEAGNLQLSVVKWTADDARILCGAADEMIRIFNAKTGEKESNFGGHVGDVSAIACSKDGAFAVSAGTDGQVLKWNLQHCKECAKSKSRISGIVSLEISEDGKWCFGGEKNGSFWVWNLNGKEDAVKLKFSDMDSVSLAVFSRTGSLFALLSGTTIKIFETATGAEKLSFALDEFEKKGRSINDISFSLDDALLLCSSYKGFVLAFDLKKGAKVGELCFDPKNDPIYSTSFHSSEHMAIFRLQRGIRCFDFATGKEVEWWASANNLRYQIFLTTDEKFSLWRGDDRDCVLLNHEKKEALSIPYNGWYSSFGYSPLTSKLALPEYDDDKEESRIRIWDLKEGSKILTTEKISNYPESLCMDPKGECVICLGENDAKHVMTIFNGATGDIKKVIEAPRWRGKDQVESLAFLLSPHGTLAIQEKENGLLDLLDACSGEKLVTIVNKLGENSVSGGHEIQNVIFSPDGRSFLLVNQNNTVCLYTPKNK